MKSRSWWVPNEQLNISQIPKNYTQDSTVEESIEQVSFKILNLIKQIYTDISDKRFQIRLGIHWNKTINFDAKVDIDTNYQQKLWSQAKKKQTSLKYKKEAKKAVDDEISKRCFNYANRKPEFKQSFSSLHENLCENEQFEIIEKGNRISSKVNHIDCLNDSQLNSHLQLSNNEILAKLNESARVIQNWKTLEDFVHKNILKWTEK